MSRCELAKHELIIERHLMRQLSQKVPKHLFRKVRVGRIGTGEAWERTSDRSCYDLVIPLDTHGRIDGEVVASFRAFCSVQRSQSGVALETGVLDERQGRNWLAQLRDADDGYVCRFSDDKFALGCTITVQDCTGAHDYRVVGLAAA